MSSTLRSVCYSLGTLYMCASRFHPYDVDVDEDAEGELEPSDNETYAQTIGTSTSSLSQLTLSKCKGYSTMKGKDGWAKFRE